MLCLAASLALGAWQDQALADPVWQKVSQSVAVVAGPAGPTGVAVLVDSRGWFLTHSASPTKGVVGSTVILRMGTAQISAKRLASDTETGLTLLEAAAWQPGSRPAVRVARARLMQGDKLVAVTLSGPRRAVVSSQNRIGQMRPSLRYLPLDEIKLEESQTTLNGAVAFNSQGELAAVLGATLADAPVQRGAPMPGGSQGFQQNDADLKNLMQNSFGPGGLAVGYTFSGALLERVVDGLLGPSHKVQHPSIGIFFKLAGQSGVALEAVMPNSTADQAGLRAGDVVLEADGTRITSPITLAIVLFNQRVGQDMSFKIRRGDQTLDVKVRVGAAQADS